MKRLSVLGFFSLLTAVLGGCPIYEEHGPGYDDPCAEGRCGPTPDCSSPAECGVNETCGADYQCHTGDCSFWGCPSGYVCNIDDFGKATCDFDTGNGGSGGGTGGSGDGGASQGGGGAGGGAGGSGGGEASIYCGNPSDCSDGETCGPLGLCEAGDCTAVGCIYGYACNDNGSGMACIAENPAACSADADCAANPGFSCVNGSCTDPDLQCLDRVQCGAGQRCADGRCATECIDDSVCAAGFGCSPQGFCTTPLVPCTITKDCDSASLVCVTGACVERSVDGSCPAGFAWMQNGCVPDQSAQIQCAVEGTQDACAVGSVCLHHGCYSSCAPQNAGLCADPAFALCKTMSTQFGTVDVCGAADNLGGKCAPGSLCVAGEMCIDGLCY